MNNFITLSQDAKQIVYGSLLGDASLRQKNNRIQFLQSIKQKEYLLWKYSFFNEEDVSNLYEYKYKKQNWENISFCLKNPNKKYDTFYKKIRKNIYDKNNVKRINEEYLKELTPLGLAVWWMDDGCLSIHKGNRYGKLCTHCFTYEEHLIIQKYFIEKWDIHIDIKLEKNKYYFCRFNVENLKKLISIIYKYVTEIPSMIYKIDLNYKNAIKLDDFEPIYNYIKSKVA